MWNPLEFQALQAGVLQSMALLEIHFPPSFFDVMMYLLYHPVDDLDMCGHVWTCVHKVDVERYMKTLKQYVANMARP